MRDSITFVFDLYQFVDHFGYQRYIIKISYKEIEIYTKKVKLKAVMCLLNE